jgi:hypothetical protein
MVALHHGGKRIQEKLRTIEWVYMNFSIFAQELLIRIEDHRRDPEPVRFSADALAVTSADGLTDDDRADMPFVHDGKSGVNRMGWNHGVSRVSKHSIADRRQYSFPGDGKHCRSHKNPYPSAKTRCTRNYDYSEYLLVQARMQEKKC